MVALFRHPWVRWSVPITVAVVAIGGAALVTQVSASADSSLPARSAAQLLVDLQSAADLTAGSGTVVQKADLGLPQLPSVGGAGSSDLTSLISGNHTLRVWYDGKNKARVALMGTLGESDVIRNGRDLWTWSSDDNAASHRLLPAEASSPSGATSDPLNERSTAGLTPQQIADKALAAVDPTTAVTTDGTAKVAGRDAYELVLTPKDSSSLIGQVRFAVDAAAHVPLRVQIFAKNGTSPALEVGFTQISFARPAAAEFRFSPPPGAKITQESSSSAPVNKSAAPRFTPPSVSGKGWTAVVQAKLPSTAGTSATSDPAATAPIDQLGLGGVLNVLPRKSGSWGSGRLLHSNLFNVLLTDSGRVLAGPVTADRLYQLAGQSIPTKTK
jgi:outer membrane lipoprotein-sorting protein